MRRIKSIDSLRGFVMILMLLDHVRETFFLHLQVSDPVDIFLTSPELFYTRFITFICAPVFIYLTGLSAWLYMKKNSRVEASKFLLKRGIFLVALEITIINFLWSGQYPPDMFFLQVIWCIGLCMVVLSLMIYLQYWMILSMGIIIVCGHNFFLNFNVLSESIFHIPWAILYQREVIEFSGIAIRTSYPVLPWIGVIALGYTSGIWFSKNKLPSYKERKMLIYGLAGIFFFFVIRFINIYGDYAWVNTGEFSMTIMSFLSLTKYPPSFMFNLLTLSLGLLILLFFEKFQSNKFVNILSQFGAASMFFYILHLLVLLIIYKTCYFLLGPNQGEYFSFPNVKSLWIAHILLSIILYYPTKWFAQYKQANKKIKWLKYF